jgi:glycosyltransferase A (GT-A) superfamily protein (DUF2064 family)
MAIWKLEGLAIDGGWMSLGYITMQPNFFDNFPFAHYK